MAGESKRSKLILTPEEVQHLERLRRSRTAPVREVRRAEILWRYHCGETIAEIVRALKMTRKSVGTWIARSRAMGVEAALKDAYHRPKQPRITAEAKAWVVHLACRKPKELGYAAELWTRSALARHVRRHAGEAGYAVLAQAAKATVHRILAAQPLHPEGFPASEEIRRAPHVGDLTQSSSGWVSWRVPMLVRVSTTAPCLEDPALGQVRSPSGHELVTTRVTECAELGAETRGGALQLHKTQSRLRPSATLEACERLNRC